MDGHQDAAEELSGDWLGLTEPDVSAAEVEVLGRVLETADLTDGKLTQAFEAAFAARIGRTQAIGVTSGTIALLLTLRAYGFGPGDEIIVSPYAWHQIVHAVALAGATPVFSDIDYWSHTLNAGKAAARITPRTKAIVAGNTNGHPADWGALRALADRHGLALIEDSTEAIGSTLNGRPVGSFGDVAIFDFSEPSALRCGGGAMIVTDDARLAHEIRYIRHREPEHKGSVVITRLLPLQAKLSNLNAALGLVQLKRLDEILERRRIVIGYYEQAMQSFEGIKPPYHAPDVTTVHPMVYAVHLGTRFTASSRKAVFEDMVTQGIEVADCGPLIHLQNFYSERGSRRGDCPVAEKTADRAVALPFSGAMTEENVDFVVQTLKDATINTGAGAAIYL